MCRSTSLPPPGGYSAPLLYFDFSDATGFEHPSLKARAAREQLKLRERRANVHYGSRAFERELYGMRSYRNVDRKRRQKTKLVKRSRDEGRRMKENVITMSESQYDYQCYYRDYDDSYSVSPSSGEEREWERLPLPYAHEIRPEELTEMSVYYAAWADFLEAGLRKKGSKHCVRKAKRCVKPKAAGTAGKPPSPKSKAKLGLKETLTLRKFKRAGVKSRTDESDSVTQEKGERRHREHGRKLLERGFKAKRGEKMRMMEV